MRPFRADGDRYVAEVGPDERYALWRVTADVVEMLAPHASGQGGPASAAEPGSGQLDDLLGTAWSSGPVAPPTDPALRRLVPDASREDDAVGQEFRRLTQADLVDEKSERLRHLARLLGAGDAVVVQRADADRFAGALTDLRLVLAERLGLTTDEQVERLYDDVVAGRARGSDARRAFAGVFLLAGWLQESLVGLMLDQLRRGAT
ncbi:DUF2017 family protein [Oerskovia flava]|uniref:DUF2017 family protein n=1 Tax=Oerskovia flava TaxID=2986422 RepID=UPI00223F8524|nr:DUF2017 family protein [Oerskovia sp. JB1-3-2]